VRKSAVVVVLALVLAVGCRREPAAPSAPRSSLAGAAAGWSVVVLSIDTLRADRLGAWGYERPGQSPRLDRLVASGVRFARAMAPRASTWPSLASVLSGLYPSGHGVLANGYSFPAAVATMPRLLRASGYQTGAFLSNMCSANHSGWDRFSCSGGRDQRAIREAADWAGSLAADRPYLLWVHLFGPHPPYYNGGARATELDPGYTGTLAPRKGALDAAMLRPSGLDAADRVHLDAIYDAAVMGTDRLAGELLDALASSGRLERTLVVLLADHGEELYEHHRYLYHACSVYQSTLHVPFALSAPGLLTEGASVPQVVELIDVLPTLLDLLGIASPDSLHGVSLRRYLERPGEGGAGKPAFSEYDLTDIRTVLADDWKLVDNPQALAPDCVEGAPPGFYALAEEELYDLRSDPGETRNLAALEPARVAALRTLLAQRFAKLGRPAAQELTEELKSELRALGYVAN
jgi:arylsulfatase A-like enzyme